MKTPKEMIQEIEMMEETRDKLLKTAEELRTTYGEAVQKDVDTLEDFAAKTEARKISISSWALPRRLP